MSSSAKSTANSNCLRIPLHPRLTLSLSPDRQSTEWSRSLTSEGKTSQGPTTLQWTDACVKNTALTALEAMDTENFKGRRTRHQKFPQVSYIAVDLDRMKTNATGKIQQTPWGYSSENQVASKR